MASASCETTTWECTVEYAEVDTIELLEIDCSLLTTLLEESEAEAENMGFSPHSPTTTASDFEDCCLEDMLSDVQEYCSTSASMEDAASFGWEDMDVVVPSSPGDDMEDWFVGADEVGMMDFEESEGYLLYSYYCDDDVHVEDGYSPLWQ